MNSIFPKTYGRHSLREFCEARDRGELCRVDDHLYSYFLDVLPPIFMGKTVRLVSGRDVRADFGFVEGADRVTAFWTAGGVRYAQHTNLFSRGG